MPYKVVLIDDEPRITKGLSNSVPWDTYKCVVVAVASNAEQGRQMIAKHKPNIIFTDISMPNEDGLTMLAGLKSQYPDMQVIVLSGYSDFNYAQRAIRYGVCRYLLKPSKMKDIDEALSEAVSRLKPLEGEESTTHDAHVSNGIVVDIALKYIKEHYNESITLHEVADHCYVSHWHLSKLLNKKIKKSYNTLLNETRIEHAKTFLKDISLSVKEISDKVGYSDTAIFSRTFKHITGMTASDYRNQLNK